LRCSRSFAALTTPFFSCMTHAGNIDPAGYEFEIGASPIA
jgi:hypothetical protein